MLFSRGPELLSTALMICIPGSRKVRNGLILSQIAIGNNATGKRKIWFIDKTSPRLKKTFGTIALLIALLTHLS